MIQDLHSKANEEQDLHISKHIESEQLPAMIKPIMNLAQSDSEKDMLLLSLLTAAGSCMPIQEAKAQGVPERTAFRWNEKWQEEGIVVRIRQGHFRKLLASA